MKDEINLGLYAGLVLISVVEKQYFGRDMFFFILHSPRPPRPSSFILAFK